jgi:CheY-like chemotaxis protein/two-component sensor histidine kinase
MAEIMESNDLGEAQRERLQVIRQSGAAVIELLNDVLDLAQIESGRLTFEPQAFSPAKLAEDAAAAFRPLAASRGLMLQVRASAEAEQLRIGDPVRVRQILSNLISNSLKFTPAGRIKVVVDVKGDELSLHVTDTGVGIAPERMDEVFRKFASSPPPGSGLRDGAGLGLAICKDICELMGGRIWLEPDRTVGAAFHVTLPLALAPAASLTDMTPVEATGEGPALDDLQPPLEEAPTVLRILAAEDNTTNRLVLEAMVGILGLELEVVGDGQEAVNAWETCDYDLILMDIQMPVLDGIGATREIRRRELETGRRRTPIVAVSANVMTHQVAEYIAAGMDDHVPKPIELARLHRAIVDAVHSQSEIENSEQTPLKTQNGHLN